MKKITLFFLFALSAASAFGQPADDKQLVAEFDKLLSEQFIPDGPGATALVARKGQVIYKKALGLANLEYNIPMQVDNVFRIGSISKQFTAVAILQLAEQGKLGLQDEITRYIPDYPTHGYKITIEHLLTHTSGIKNYTDIKGFGQRMTLDLTPTEMIDYFKNQPMNFAPGTKWDYSNSGYFLLGYIIEKVSGKSYPQYVEEHFFKPLGMTHSLYGSDRKIVKGRAGAYSKDSTGYVHDDNLSMTQPYAAGSLQSTVEDLFKWHQAVHAYKLVKKESLDKAFLKYKLASGKQTEYGYGWGLGNVQESPTIEHGGGIPGFLTMCIYLPKEDVFVAVFSNCMCNPPFDIAAKMAALTIGKPYDYKEKPVDKKLLQQYTGVYENEEAEQVLVTVADGQLYMQHGGGPNIKVKAYQPDRFFFESMTASIAFSRNAKGDIVTFAVSGRQPAGVWTKTSKALPSMPAKQ